MNPTCSSDGKGEVKINTPPFFFLPLNSCQHSPLDEGKSQWHSLHWSTSRAWNMVGKRKKWDLGK